MTRREEDRIVRALRDGKVLAEPNVPTRVKLPDDGVLEVVTSKGIITITEVDDGEYHYLVVDIPDHLRNEVSGSRTFFFDGR